MDELTDLLEMVLAGNRGANSQLTQSLIHAHVMMYAWMDPTHGCTSRTDNYNPEANTRQSMSLIVQFFTAET